jgi:BirA family biotin operon repressor/biotin-[acetyl-CoA-carboxylase] ligase
MRRFRFAQLDSSNEEAKRMVKAGEALPFAVLCAAQSAGRGRNGRPWESAPGHGLCVSVVVAASSLPEPITLAPLAIGCGLADALRDLGIAVQLKWPNDLRVGGAKIGGILCEGVDACLIVGVGLNWWEAPELEAQRTCAAASFLARLPARQEAEELVLEGIDAGLRRWRDEGGVSVQGRWWALAERGAVAAADQCGEILGVAADGALRLRDRSGAVHEVRCGEVTAVKW